MRRVRRFPIWRAYFSKGLKPPTKSCMSPFVESNFHLGSRFFFTTWQPRCLERTPFFPILVYLTFFWVVCYDDENPQKHPGWHVMSHGDGFLFLRGDGRMAIPITKISPLMTKHCRRNQKDSGILTLCAIWHQIPRWHNSECEVLSKNTQKKPAKNHLVVPLGFLDVFFAKILPTKTPNKQKSRWWFHFLNYFHL